MLLRRTSPDQAGWTRRRAGKGFVYLDERGERLGEEDAARCRALVIPPAWRDVWICPYPRGHLQAVGTDEAGRRQYIYHPAWVEQRSAEKYDRVMRFGRRLPRVRQRVLTDLALGDVCEEVGCALAVRLLDLGYFRIGNDVYAMENGSFGLTTLERRHVRRQRDVLVFQFTGKSGVEHRTEVDDPVVVELLDRMRRRRSSSDPSLLCFRVGRRWRSLTPELVNEYLREVSGLDASAKDFRTWHATVIAAAALAEAPGPEASKTARKRAVAATMREVAEYLGNTPTLARSAYVDPRVIDAYDEGRTIRSAVRRTYEDPDQRQAGLERALLRLIG
ncbi:DNA topoisomerase IB [Nocardioides bizhenqiangii]|uniref:DNA topoisomerase n=1 Tax=Nocardioides bizhenqiangii TaxID=3095076 RepID=A0ABZ0ZRW9_9ACTN|nr:MULTISPECIES: DNA topoisomerase IB [unclassified Nocardioides]MDZ5622824.1 DNA topoisomerase IB [Nocardioides sp. HM23]WQQ27084.1 DNA topoisomerase IB [Nocardioides sp. HM61]